MKLPNFSAYLPASPASGPSKKFIFAVLIGLIIITAGFLIFTPAKKQETAKQEPQINKPAISQEIAKDSDNDGLQDWEETLWGTDPNNPDADKDGVPDGQEVKENRDPLLAGNGKTDKIESPKPEKIAGGQIEELPPTLTGILGQEFLNDYLLVKEKGTGNISTGSISEEDKAAVLENFLGIVQNFENQNDDYLKSDIRISPSENEKTIKEYGNNLAIIIKKYFDSIPESEMAIFQRALINQDAAELQKMGRLADAYRGAAKEALSLKAPLSFSEKHLALINHFNNIAKEIDAMQKIFEDPALALIGFRQYIESVGPANQILHELNSYFSGKKIAFKTGEPAEFFKINYPNK